MTLKVFVEARLVGQMDFECLVGKINIIIIIILIIKLIIIIITIFTLLLEYFKKCIK